MQRQSELLEQEAERARALLSDTMDELRHGLSGSRLVALLPAAVVGGGLVWLVSTRFKRAKSKPSFLAVSARHSRSGGRSPVLMSGIGALATAAIVALLSRREGEVLSTADGLTAGSAVPRTHTNAVDWRTPATPPVARGDGMAAG